MALQAKDGINGTQAHSVLSANIYANYSTVITFKTTKCLHEQADDGTPQISHSELIFTALIYLH